MRSQFKEAIKKKEHILKNDHDQDHESQRR